MNRLERDADPTASMLAMLRGWQAGVFTSDVGIIDSYNPATETCEVIIATQQRVRGANNVESWVTLPKLVDVPVSFPGGGGFTLTFPVEQGDECVIVFAQRCIDAWFQSGGVQLQAELRMHDISDGIAFVGIKSQTRLLSGGAHAANVQLRSDSGAAYLEMTPAGALNIVAPGGVTINGNVATVGTLTNNGKNAGSTHTHPGITPGGSSTGAPN